VLIQIWLKQSKIYFLRAEKSFWVFSFELASQLLFDHLRAVVNHFAQSSVQCDPKLASDPGRGKGEWQISGDQAGSQHCGRKVEHAGSEQCKRHQWHHWLVRAENASQLLSKQVFDLRRSSWQTLKQTSEQHRDRGAAIRSAKGTERMLVRVERLHPRQVDHERRLGAGWKQQSLQPLNSRPIERAPWRG